MSERIAILDLKKNKIEFEVVAVDDGRAIVATFSLQDGGCNKFSLNFTESIAVLNCLTSVVALSLGMYSAVGVMPSPFKIQLEGKLTRIFSESVGLYFDRTQTLYLISKLAWLISNHILIAPNV